MAAVVALCADQVLREVRCCAALFDNDANDTPSHRLTDTKFSSSLLSVVLGDIPQLPLPVASRGKEVAPSGTFSSVKDSQPFKKTAAKEKAYQAEEKALQAAVEDAADELAILSRLLYKNKNQHRNAKFFKGLVNAKKHAEVLFGRQSTLLAEHSALLATVRRLFGMLRRREAGKKAMTRAIGCPCAAVVEVAMHSCRALAAVILRTQEAMEAAALGLRAELMLTYFMPFCFTTYASVGRFHTALGKALDALGAWASTCHHLLGLSLPERCHDSCPGSTAAIDSLQKVAGTLGWQPLTDDAAGTGSDSSPTTHCSQKKDAGHHSFSHNTVREDDSQAVANADSAGGDLPQKRVREETDRSDVLTPPKKKVKKKAKKAKKVEIGSFSSLLESPTVRIPVRSVTPSFAPGSGSHILSSLMAGTSFGAKKKSGTKKRQKDMLNDKKKAKKKKKKSFG